MEALETQGIEIIATLNGGSRPIYLIEENGRKAILKEAQGDEADKIKALVDIGVDTAKILGVRGKYLVLEYIDMPNLAEDNDFDQDALAEAIADFHKSVYLNRDKLREVTDQTPEGERVKRRIERIEKESSLEKTIKSFISGFATEVMKEDFWKKINPLINQIPDEEGHNDLRVFNILGKGKDYVLIDMAEVGQGYFANDLVRIAMSLKAVGKQIDEERFKQVYFDELINDGVVEKTPKQFEKEYNKIAKILTGLGRATTYVKAAEAAKSPGERRMHEKHIDVYVGEALEAMSPKEREAFADYLEVNGFENKYAKEILQRVKDYERENVSLAGRVVRNVGRKCAKVFGLGMATAASVGLLVAVYNWTLMSKVEKLLKYKQETRVLDKEIRKVEMMFYKIDNDPFINECLAEIEAEKMVDECMDKEECLKFSHSLNSERKN